MKKSTARPAAVAGMFYPQDADELRTWIVSALQQASTDKPPAKAMVVPHAGYVYSGEVAAMAYARLKNRLRPIERVVLLGPAHRVEFQGIAVPTVDFFDTPLGKVTLDTTVLRRLEQLPRVIAYDLPHAQEHSLEVQLPFLQVALNDFKLVPLLVGSVTSETVAAVLQKVWGGDETLVIVSSDLSHFHQYDTATRIDAETSSAIEAGNDNQLISETACGYLPLRGLMQVARAYGMQAHTIDLRNSGDTAGSRDRVVGYGAYVFQ